MTSQAKKRGVICLLFACIGFSFPVSATEIDWIDGETCTGTWTLHPTHITTNDPIHFSGPTGTHSNACGAEVAGGGHPTIHVDEPSKTIELFFQPPAPDGCPTIYAPVCGLEGTFEPLSSGDWLFFSHTYLTDFEIPFFVEHSTDTLRVVSLVPLPGAVLTSPPAEVRAVFSRELDLHSVDTWTATLSRSGNDAILGNGNDVFVAAAAVDDVLSTNVSFNLADRYLPDDLYQVAFRGELEFFPDTDAELLALALSHELLPPPNLYEQIHEDLTAIRRDYPIVEAIHHHPHWAPGELIIGMEGEAWSQFLDGTYHGFDDLNARYGPVRVSRIFHFISAFVVEFPMRYNPGYLAVLYESPEGVRYAEPNFSIGDGPNIEADPPLYTFEYGWGDCPAGCTGRHIWEFSVVDGVATLVDESGPPLPIDLSTERVKDPSGNVLDGEFSGTWPSGDGTAGGNFVTTFTIDTTPPWADLFIPWDNAEGDYDKRHHHALVNRTLERFGVTIDDARVGVGVDEDTVNPEAITVERDGARLRPDLDYRFSYIPEDRLIYLDAIDGEFGDGAYRISICSGGAASIADRAGNEAQPTEFSVVIDTAFTPTAVRPTSWILYR